jgi:excisionase family DNA binding protein
MNDPTPQETPRVQPRTRGAIDPLADYPHALTVTEVAEVLRCDWKTVRRAIEAGGISAIRMGRLIRVGKPEVRRLLRDGLR